jgi:hypothetical protein
MRRLELGILENAYELSLGGHPLTRLEGGPLALLADAGLTLRDVDVEAAIEHAEDWLMPTSKSFQGFALHVRDTPGRLRERLGAHASLTPEDVESAFSRALDRKRTLGRESIADLVLVRELVHHGKLSRILLG